MTRRAIPAVLLVPLLIVALVVSTSACGTIANFNGGQAFIIGAPPDPPSPPIAYGGVLWDVEQALKSEAEIGTKALIFPAWLLELGLSATLDTATLPIVFYVNARKAWSRMNGGPPARPASTERGWFREPYKPTPAETVLNPSAADEDPD